VPARPSHDISRGANTGRHQCLPELMVALGISLANFSRQFLRCVDFSADFSVM
jgi:hypothetical protein